MLATGIETCYHCGDDPVWIYISKDMDYIVSFKCNKHRFPSADYYVEYSIDNWKLRNLLT